MATAFYGIIPNMERFFNIAGPCNPVRHYTLPAMARLPDVVSFIRKEQHFAVHAQRQCGKIDTGKGALDLGVLFRSGKYAVEVKLKYLYEKNREAGDWDSKLSHEDVAREDKTVHLFRC